jgi:hypothetical protein
MARSALKTIKKPKLKSKADAARIAKRLAKARQPFSISDLDNEFAAEAEFGVRVTQDALRLRSKLASRNSGKTWKAPTRDPIVDRDVFVDMQRAWRCGATVKLAAKAGPLVVVRRYPIHVNEWKKIDQDIQRQRRRQMPDLSKWIITIQVPHWDHTGDKLKALSWAMMMNQTQCRSITLRLGPDRIAVGSTHKHGIARYMHGLIQRQLKAEFAKLGERPPEFFIVIEATEFGEVHIHGAVTMSGHDQALPAIRKALKAAGGKWVGPSGVTSGRQLDTKKLTTSIRWMHYASKWALQSADRIDGSVFAASNDLRTRGQAWYNAARKHGFVIRPGPAWTDHGSLLDEHEREVTCGPLLQ